jgi:hypothetical protein
VLVEDRLDEISAKLEHYPSKFLQYLAQNTRISSVPIL